MSLWRLRSPMTGCLQTGDPGIPAAQLSPSPKTKGRRRKVYPSTRRERGEFSFLCFYSVQGPSQMDGVHLNGGQHLVHSDSHTSILWKHIHLNTCLKIMLYQFSKYSLIQSSRHLKFTITVSFLL